MARDDSRRPTPRQKTPKTPKTPKAKPAKAPKTPKAPKAPKMPKMADVAKVAKTAKAAKTTAAKAPKAAGPKLAPTARSAGATGSARPPFLERAAAAAQGAVAPRASSGRERRQRYQRGQMLKVAAGVLAGIAALALVVVVVLFALRDSSVFSIDSVQVEPSTHVTEQDVQNLVKVPVGSTLLNVDTASIETSLKRDPWVASVSFERVFPHTLKIVVTEQSVAALVVMSSGSVAWYLSDSNTWIQPASVTPAEGQSVSDAALALALAEGCLLVTDVPATVQPESGATATDESLDAVRAFHEGFSEEFSSQIVSFSAPSPDGVACTLSNGVEVLLGSPEDISTKEAIVTKTLEKYPEGTLTYINVRVTTDPSVRPVGSEDVEAGTGVTAIPPATQQQDAQQGQQQDAAQGEGDAAQQGGESQQQDAPQGEGDQQGQGDASSNPEVEGSGEGASEGE